MAFGIKILVLPNILGEHPCRWGNADYYCSYKYVKETLTLLYKHKQSIALHTSRGATNLGVVLQAESSSPRRLCFVCSAHGSRVAHTHFYPETFNLAQTHIW